jgi:MFS superfamily sulfate permease-like transporter
VNEVGIPAVATFVKAFLPAQLFYTVSIGLTKLSILAFYWRLFAVAGRWPIVGVGIVVFSWVVIIVSVDRDSVPGAQD